eukprot:m.17296 g.17296  ORF g.17296 m.17296 type:complete len:382 (-) comp5978_c0_seq1:1210-2355(-)
MPWTELHVAAEKGDEEAIKNALEQGVDVNALDDGEQSALHRAAGFGRQATAELLIDAKADVNAKDDSGSTALHLAAWKGQVGMAELLVISNANLDSKGLYGDTALHLAASYGQQKVAEILVHSNADVNAKDNAGKTPLDWAKESNQTSIIALLLRMGGQSSTWKPNPQSETLPSQAPTCDKEYLCKVIVVGDTGTGKTSIIKRVVQGTFSSQYKATIGVDFAMKVIDLDENTTVRLQLWDIAGQERFGTMTRVYYKEAVGAFIVCDMTRKSTFETVANWKEDIDEKVTLPDGDPIPVVLLGNKCDLNDEIEIEQAELQALAERTNMKACFLTSARENLNLDESIRCLIENILEAEKLHTDADPDRFQVKDTNSNTASCCWW